MYAVIESGGKQLQVEPGQMVLVEKLPLSEGDEVIFDRVLMLSEDDEKVTLGTPTVEGARVVGRVISQERARKVIVFKYVPKTRIRRKKGHRQPATRVRIECIEA